MMPSSSLRCVQLSRIAEKAIQSSVYRKHAATASSRLRKFSHDVSQHCSTRCISTTSACFRVDNDKDGTKFHSLYHEQMKEIDSEREAIFGPSSDDASPDSQDLSTLAKTYNDKINDTTQQSETVNGTTRTTGELWDTETREEAYEEREALFQFSDEEKNAWSNNGGMQQIDASQMHILRQVMKGESSNQHQHQDATEVTPSSNDSAQPFSHLNHQGDGVSMVDVGHKAVTRRIATAKSSVIFPPEVLSAFQLRTTQEKGHRSSEMIGPKGPIFETAKIAGIMAAKRTSDLIPLCHPLPLDRVNIDIQLIDNRAIIECECRVTHKTGVEMEALTGATVAALTIYDMVKAVSHRVEIGNTALIGKTGGKSDFKAS